MPSRTARGTSSAAAPGDPGAKTALTPGQLSTLERWRFEQLEAHYGDEVMLAELEAVYNTALGGGMVVESIEQRKAIQSPSGVWFVAPDIADQILSLLVGLGLEGTDEELQKFLGSEKNRRSLGIE